MIGLENQLFVVTLKASCESEGMCDCVMEKGAAAQYLSSNLGRNEQLCITLHIIDLQMLCLSIAKSINPGYHSHAWFHNVECHSSASKWLVHEDKQNNQIT